MTVAAPVAAMVDAMAATAVVKGAALVTDLATAMRPPAVLAWVTLRSAPAATPSSRPKVH